MLFYNKSEESSYLQKVLRNLAQASWARLNAYLVLFKSAKVVKWKAVYSKLVQRLKIFLYIRKKCGRFLWYRWLFLCSQTLLRAQQILFEVTLAQNQDRPKTLGTRLGLSNHSPLIFWLSFHFSRFQNRSFFAPKANGNACYAGYFRCSVAPGNFPLERLDPKSRVSF